MSRRSRREALARRRAVRRMVELSLQGELDEQETPAVLRMKGRTWHRVDDPRELPARGVTARHCGRVYVRPYLRGGR